MCSTIIILEEQEFSVMVIFMRGENRDPFEWNIIYI